MKPTLITSYTNPDLDGVACAMAYAELLGKQGENAAPVFFGEPQREATWVMEKFGFAYPKSPKKNDGQIILVDHSSFVDFPAALNPKRVVEIIDHRKNSQLEYFPNARVQIEQVGSCATLIAEKFVSKKIGPSNMSATLLYAAIISSTMNFRGALTTDRDRAVAARLNEKAKLPISFAREMFLEKSDLSGNKLSSIIDGDFFWLSHAGKKIGIAQIEMIGAEKLVRERKEEILQGLGRLKLEKKLDYIFLSIVELEGELTVFVTDHAPTQDLLSRLFGVRFDGDSAVRKGLIMRKEIIPLLKEELEKHAQI